MAGQGNAIFQQIPTEDNHSNRVQSNVTDAFNRFNKQVSDKTGAIDDQITTINELIAALQAAIGGLTLPTTIKVNAAVSVGQSSSYTSPANGYAELTITATGSYTIAGQSAVNVPVGSLIVIGPSQTILTGTGCGIAGVEFINN